MQRNTIREKCLYSTLGASLSLCLAPDDHFTTVNLRASNIEQLQGFASVCRHSRARNSNHCQHKPSATYKAISTTVLSSLYKPIISFPLVPKQAYVSWKTKKKQITSNLNPVLFSGDSFIAHKDKRGATGRNFIMCLSISEHKRSSKAEWNEKPWAYVFKSQLSQARLSLYNAEDVTGTGISFDREH